MPDPTGRVSHLPHFHRGVSWKQPVRVATTASITIATALNNGDSLDGVTLATGDRVLVKDQSTASQNGIYVVGASPGRDYDFDQDGTTTVPAEEIAGAFVYVLAGTVNAGTLWHTTNVAGGTLGTTSVVWEEFTGGAAGVTVHDDLTGRDSTANHSTYLTNLAGEGHVLAIIADAGATETLDLSTANVFQVGLSTGCTLTLTPPTDDGKARAWELVFSGSFAVTWPGSVVWLDGDGTAPAASTTLAVTLVTLDGGTTYLASAGRGSLPVAADVSIADAGGYYTGTDVEAALQEIGADLSALGTGQTDHEHINSIWFSGDGSTTVFEIPAAPFDEYAVVVFVSGVQTDVTLSGTLLTTMTFGSAPASAANNIRVDIVAAVS